MKAAAICHACLALAGTLFGGCSSQQLYGAGQQWQRTECNKLNDRDERTRCERSAATSYESYKSQAEAAKKP